MKTLLSTLILGGSLILGGCELEKYSEQNQQIYKDAAQFVRENGKNKSDENHTKFLYKTFNSDSTEKLSIKLWDNKDLYLNTINFWGGENPSYENFIDYNSDGFDEQEWCIIMSDYSFIVGGYGNRERQLNCAEEYTNTLKEVMHNAKYKNY